MLRARALLAASVIANVIVLASACDEGAASVPASPATQEAHAAGAMCAEHGVLEAVCTKCNPSLVAVFRARHDFCEEHGFPESFCPICHPERGGRPATLPAGGAVAAPSAIADGEGPADGTRVRFRSRESARLAGFRYVAATERSTQRDVAATVRIVFDASRVAEMNARMPGVVRSIRADVGSTVRVGGALAVIESAEIGLEQSRLQAATSRVSVAEANVARSESLRPDGIVSERSLLAARQDLEAARADVRSARATLGMVGAGGGGAARYTLTSPIAGVVLLRNASVGEFVETDEVLFRVVDASQMWAELAVPEAELPLVHAGQVVSLALDGIPDQEITGTLAYLAPAIDPHTRTAVARVALANPDGTLRENLYGRARIVVDDPSMSVLVPTSAVQRARGSMLVFVRVEADVFEARRVVLGATAGELSVVTGRLRAGELVVTEGSFLLKTETLKESIGAGCCDVD